MGIFSRGVMDDEQWRRLAKEMADILAEARLEKGEPLTSADMAAIAPQTPQD